MTEPDWPSIQSSVRHAIRIRVPKHEVEDLTQDVLERLVSRWGQQTPTQDNLLAYAQVSAVNRCKAWWKDQQRLRWTSLNTLLDEGVEFDLDQVIRSREPSRCPDAAIRELCDQLSRRDRVVLDLHFLKGMSLNETARAMRLPARKLRRSKARILREAKRLELDPASFLDRESTS